MSFSNNNEEESQYINSISGIAISNKSILILSTIGFGILGLVLFYILRRLTDQQTNQDDNEERDYGEILNDSDVATLNRAQRRARAKYRMKNARRVAQPVQVNNNGEDGEEDENHNQDNVPQVNNNLSRKERQRVAKKKEREERKVSAEEARKWREKNQSKPAKKTIDKDIMPEESKVLAVEDVFPQRANVNDVLSEYMFREYIVKNIKQMDISNEDKMISVANQIPKMTIHEFIERLKQNGSISISSLADEFNITEQECLDQLEVINKQHGIIGVVDSKGCFVYVSMEMIKEAIKLGNDAGRIVCPKSSLPPENQSDQDECLAANET